MAKGQGNIGHTEEIIYRDFFSKNKNDFFHSGKYGYGYSKNSAIKALKKSGTITRVGHIHNGGTYLKGSQLVRHYRLLRERIEQAVWLFIQAAGSHSKRMFQDSFSKKSFTKGLSSDGSGVIKKWRKLSKKTEYNRKRLGLWPGTPYGGQLTSTGRLHDSITLATVKVGGKGVSMSPSVKVFTDPAKFKGTYPEWFGSGRRSRAGSGAGVVKGKRKNFKKYSTIIYGRKDRVYAGWHNEQHRGTLHKPMQRKFMGVTDALMDSKMMSLIDDYLFYYVFNSSLGEFTEAQYQKNKRDERAFLEAQAHFAEMRRAKAEKAMYGMNSGFE